MSLYGFFAPLSFVIAITACCFVAFGTDPVTLAHHIMFAIHNFGQPK